MRSSSRSRSIHDDATVSIEEVITDAAESEDDATVLDLDHDTPAVVFINRAISKALDLGASDIHFTPQQRRLFVRVRVDGVMRELTSIAGTQAQRRREPAQDHGRARHRRAAGAAGRSRLDQARQGVSIDVRIAILPTTHGEKVTLRILSQGEAPDSLDALGHVAA